jgi:hypothetical protein
MFPLQVDPKWYENYWYSDRPRPRRRSFGGSVARFAMLVGLLAGGGLVLSHLHHQNNMDGYAPWEQE